VRGYQTEVIDRETGNVVMKGGKPVTKPVATEYFILVEEIDGATEEVYAMLGTDQPRLLPIRLMGNRPEEVFPQYCELFRGDKVMRCKGTGGSAEKPGLVVYRRAMRKQNGDLVDEIAVKNIGGTIGAQGALKVPIQHYADAWKKEYGTDKVVGNTVVCLGEDCPKYSLTGCRPTGRLMFTIKGVERSGHWELVVHTLAIMSFNYQLDQVLNFITPYVGPRLAMVPFLLSMGPAQRIKLPDRYITYYDPRLEVDPEWFRSLLSGKLALPKPPEVSREDVWAEVPAIPAPLPEEAEELSYSPEEDEVAVEEVGEEPVVVNGGAEAVFMAELASEPEAEVEPEPESEPEPVVGEVLAAERFKEWLLSTVNPNMMTFATQPQQNYVAMMLNAVFGNGATADDARHEFLGYLFGEKSVKRLNKGQAHALIDWLKTDECRGIGDTWEPSPVVVAQANAVIRQLGEDEGQLEMFE